MTEETIQNQADNKEGHCDDREHDNHHDEDDYGKDGNNEKHSKTVKKGDDG